jgi:hypothetical protein
MKQLYSTQYPPHHLLNPAKRYTPAAHTNIRETFAQFAGAIHDSTSSPLSLQPESRQITQSSSRLCLDSLET